MSIEHEISAAEIFHKNFSTKMFGYNKEEVEKFLERIAVYIEDLEKKLSQQSKQKIPAKKDDSFEQEQKNREELISKTLMSAEKTRDELVKNARQEAANIVKEAELQGKQMIAEAKNYVSVLEHQLYNLEDNKRQFLMKFKSEMESILRRINEDELIKSEKNDDNPEFFEEEDELPADTAAEEAEEESSDNS